MCRGMIYLRLLRSNNCSRIVGLGDVGDGGVEVGVLDGGWVVGVLLLFCGIGIWF